MKVICKMTNQEGTTEFSSPMEEEIGIFTMIAKDEYRNDVSDAFLVEEPQLITALNDLLALDGATYVEIYEGAVRDGDGCRPLPWET
jgi:hypothetical protein